MITNASRRRSNLLAKRALLRSKLASFRKMHSTANTISTKAEIARIDALLAS